MEEEWRDIKRIWRTLSSKRVEQYDLQGNLINEWDSINEAQKQLNIGNISKCCRKDKNYTTVGGYIWRYVEENEFMEEK